MNNSLYRGESHTMSFWAFCAEHYILAFFMLCAAYYITRAIVVRGTRSFMVAMRGWPPSHLDADGDWKPEPEKETTE